MSEKEMLQEYAKARALVESLDEQLKKAKARRERAELKLINSLQDRDATATAKYPEIGSVSLSKPRVRASVLAENRETLHDHLKENGYGALVKEAVNSQTLNKYVSSLLEEGTELPLFIQYYLQQGITFRKS